MESADGLSLGPSFHLTADLFKENKGEAMCPQSTATRRRVCVLAVSFIFLYSDALISGALLTLEGVPLPGQPIPRDERHPTPAGVRFSDTHQPIQSPRPTTCLFTSWQLSTCSDPPRARYQPARESLSSPGPAEIMQTSQP